MIRRSRIRVISTTSFFALRDGVHRRTPFHAEMFNLPVLQGIPGAIRHPGPGPRESDYCTIWVGHVDRYEKLDD